MKPIYLPMVMLTFFALACGYKKTERTQSSSVSVSKLELEDASASTTPLPDERATDAGFCPPGRVVTTAEELSAALEAAKPGDIFNLASGTYVGPFKVTVSGTEASPITLCGPADAIIDGKGKSRGFHLLGANWWHLGGFELKNSNKGLGLTNANHNTVTGLFIHSTRGASVHINTFSSDNVFDGLTLRNAGAEGFYVGSAVSNWCLYSDCQPDTSDRNIIRNCDIASTDDEAIDIKEGTTGGKALNNRINGSKTASNKGWINVKGNGYLIADNVGMESQDDGYAVHRIRPGWGNDNIFTGNTAILNGPHFGFYVQGGTTGNSVACNQNVVGAGEGAFSVACDP